MFKVIVTNIGHDLGMFRVGLPANGVVEIRKSSKRHSHTSGTYLVHSMIICKIELKHT